MTRVLLTGASGFLGEKLSLLCEADESIDLRKLARNEVDGDASFISCDLTKRSAVTDVINKIEPDVIIHAAAFVPKALTDYNSDLSSTNLQMVENLIGSTSAKFINISSMTVYGSSITVVRDERSLLEPQSAYGEVKLEIENFLMSKCDCSLSIRIPGLFGAQRKTGLVYNLLRSLNERKKLQLPDGPILWSSMNVSDAAESIFKVTKKFISDRYKLPVINISYRDRLSISRLVRMCEEIYGVDLDYSVDHPDFEFCLKELDSLSAVPDISFRTALLKLKDEYGL